jgi:hypothetical protein
MNKKTIYAFDIDYDTDENGNQIEGLPKELKFRVSEDFDAENELADLITDETRFLVNGCSFRWTK